MANKKELIQKSQTVRGGYTLLQPDHDECVSFVEKSSKSRPDEINDETIKTPEKNDDDKELQSTEIYDDTDFYHQLLRELIEFKTTTTNPAEISKQYSELEKLRKKMKKIVDTRASKGRKIRYVVHKKLVNFMAPNPYSDWTNESKDELYSSLFGKSDKSIDVNGSTVNV